MSEIEILQQLRYGVSALVRLAVTAHQDVTRVTEMSAQLYFTTVSRLSGERPSCGRNAP